MAWAALNRKERKGKGRRHVGLWHETYVVPEGVYESIYADMPAFGLAAATGTLPLKGRGRSAKERFAHWSGKEVSAWAPCGCWALAAAG